MSREIVTGLFGFFVGLLLTDLYEKGKLSSRNIFIATAVLGLGVVVLRQGGISVSRPITVLLISGFSSFVLLMLGKRSVSKRLYYKYKDMPRFITTRFGRKPSTADLEAKATRLVLPTGEPFVRVSPKSAPFGIDSQWDSRIRKSRRPVVFIKMRPREYLPWLDAAYYLLLRDLKQIGCCPVVYLYDFSYRTVDADEPEVSSSTDLASIVSNTCVFATQIVGTGINILKGSRYFKRRKAAQRLHDFLYSEVFPTIANEVSSPKTLDAKRQTARSLLFDLHGYPTILVAKLLSRKRSVYALQWEQRADKWNLTTFDQDIRLLLTRTLSPDSHPLRIRESIHLTDNETIIRQKIRAIDQRSGDMELRLMCCLLLYRNATDNHFYDWTAFVSCSDPLQVQQVTQTLIQTGFLSGADMHSVIPALRENRLTAERRNQLETSPELIKAYLHHAVFSGVLSFQKQFGLEEYVTEK